jgi:hypothetical protein
MSCAVVRDSEGDLVQAVMTYLDGRSEMAHHVSPRDVVGPVSMTLSTRKSKTHKGRSTVLPSRARVTFEGHREVPESQQTWEIHLQPKHRPES